MAYEPSAGRRAGALLILRLALGVVFLAHGSQKLFGAFGGGGIEGTGQFFGMLGLPAPTAMAALAGLIEFVGGLALLVGLLTRLAALGLTLQMIFATYWVHLPNGFFLNLSCAQGKGHGIEFNLVLIAGLVALMLVGAGLWSCDAKLPRRKKRPIAI